MTVYSTKQAAQAAGISRLTLLRWLQAGKVPEPRRMSMAGVEVRVWTERDVKRVRRYKDKFYCKGRGRKPKLKE